MGLFSKKANDQIVCQGCSALLEHARKTVFVFDVFGRQVADKSRKFGRLITREPAAQAYCGKCAPAHDFELTGYTYGDRKEEKSGFRQQWTEKTGHTFKFSNDDIVALAKKQAKKAATR